MYRPDPALAGPVLKAIYREAKRAGRPSQRTYRDFVQGNRRLLRTLVDQLGQISPDQFGQMMADLIQEGHVEAGVLGRQLSGDVLPRSTADEVWGRLAMSGQQQYLDRFVQALKDQDPRYWQDDKWRHDQIYGRASLYTDGYLATANTAFVETSLDDEFFDWVMLGSEPCPDCPERQAGSPYTKATLPSKPGDSQTACKMKCLCVLVRYDGVVGFARVFEEASDEELPDLFKPVEEGEEIVFV